MELQKKTKFYFSLMKEKMWLEQMALKGWFLKNIKLGVRYTFEKKEPKHMVYEIDRFNLPKNPSLSEIKNKAEFLEMAEEMGWQIVTYDTDLNYYLCKEYQEGEINELYTDDEARKIHAEKYMKHYQRVAGIYYIQLIILLIFLYPIQLAFPYLKGVAAFFVPFVLWITLIYIVIIIFAMQQIARLYYEEMFLSKEEWILQQEEKKSHKKIYKLIFRTSTLKKFLEKESQKGFQIIQMNAVKYSFRKEEPKDYAYNLDSKYLMNKRRKSAGEDEFKEEKDKSKLGNDWQIQSIKDAKEKGWEFVCALENRAVLYRSLKIEQRQALNCYKDERKIRIISIIGEYGVRMIFCVLIGACIGFIIGIF